MDSFQQKTLVVAMAGAFGGLLASSAGAAYVAEVPASVSGATIVKLSGASAQDIGLRNVIRRMCQASTLTQYTFSNQNAYLCTANTSAVTIPTANLLIYKTSVGGSANGVGPVASATNLVFMDLATMFSTNLATCANAVETIGTPALPTFQTRICTSSTPVANGIAQAGLSDVEPALLNATLAQQAALNAKGTSQLVFAIPVTLTMYRGLQAAQGLGSDDTQANMPSLSRAQVGAIFAGAIATTDGLLSPNGAALPSFPLVVAQRVSTSGSQSISEVFFLNKRCTPSAVGFGDPDATYTADVNAYNGCRDADPSGPFRAANSGATQVQQCLRGADKAGKWGIGLLSTEIVPAVTDANGTIRHIKIDGSAPTLLNVALGKYLFVAEQSMQWQNSLTATSNAPLYNVVNYIRTNSANPDVLKSINTSFVQVYGQSGLIGVPDGATVFPPAAPLTDANILATPVNTWSKSNVTSLANCSAPQIVNVQQTFAQ